MLVTLSLILFYSSQAQICPTERSKNSGSQSGAYSSGGYGYSSGFISDNISNNKPGITYNTRTNQVADPSNGSGNSKEVGGVKISPKITFKKGISTSQADSVKKKTSTNGKLFKDYKKEQ